MAEKTKNSVTNPNGANQYNVDPRQGLFLSFYMDPTSDTWSNALQSALKAGYSEEYANNITGNMPVWLSESIGKHQRMLNKAEIKLEAFMDSDDEKIAQDTTKFIAKTIGKSIYSERSEMTGANGKDLIPEAITEEERQAIKTLLGK